MKRNKTLDLVEALRGNHEKVSILFGLLAVGFLGLSIFIFGTQAKFSWVTFPAYILCTVLFIYTGNRIVDKNAWFFRLYMILNSIQILLALAGWIWVLYLAQGNPGERYTALVNLPFYSFILFFLTTFLAAFASLMLSIVGSIKRNKK